jgi:hypothetical protein
MWQLWTTVSASRSGQGLFVPMMMQGTTQKTAPKNMGWTGLVDLLKKLV